MLISESQSMAWRGWIQVERNSMRPDERRAILEDVNRGCDLLKWFLCIYSLGCLKGCCVDLMMLAALSIKYVSGAALDSTTGVTRDTIGRIAERLGVDRTGPPHLALHGNQLLPQCRNRRVRSCLTSYSEMRSRRLTTKRFPSALLVSQH
jgi:hypothetical protein